MSVDIAKKNVLTQPAGVLESGHETTVSYLITSDLKETF